RVDPATHLGELVLGARDELVGDREAVLANLGALPSHRKSPLRPLLAGHAGGDDHPARVVRDPGAVDDALHECADPDLVALSMCRDLCEQTAQRTVDDLNGVLLFLLDGGRLTGRDSSEADEHEPCHDVRWWRQASAT